MREQIKNILTDLGANVCGISNIERFDEALVGFSPRDIWSDCKSVIAFGVNLPKGLTKVARKRAYIHETYSCTMWHWISCKNTLLLNPQYGTKDCK